MKVLSLDPSFANTGWCIAEVDPENLTVEQMLMGGLIQTEKASVKTIRRSSDDLRRASELAAELKKLGKAADIVFAEIPSGTQNARAAWALGVSLGVLTNLYPTPIIEVTPTMTKLGALGRKDATKDEIIEWASVLYPKLPWIQSRGKEKISPRNEHMADSVGVLHAGLKHEDFRTFVHVYRRFGRPAA